MQREPSTSILLFLGIVGLTLFGLGWAIDNGFSLPEPEKLIASLEQLKERLVEADLVKISLNSSNPSEDDDGGKEEVESVSSQLAKLTFFQ